MGPKYFNMHFSLSHIILGKRREGDVWMDINIIISTTKHSHKYQNIIQITKIIFYFIRRNLFNEKMRSNKSWWKTSRQSCELYMLQLVQ